MGASCATRAGPVPEQQKGLFLGHTRCILSKSQKKSAHCCYLINYSRCTRSRQHTRISRNRMLWFARKTDLTQGTILGLHQWSNKHLGRAGETRMEEEFCIGQKVHWATTYMEFTQPHVLLHYQHIALWHGGRLLHWTKRALHCNLQPRLWNHARYYK